MRETLPEVERIQLDDPFIEGAAITVPGRPEPLLVCPFRDQGLAGAYVLDRDTVLFTARDPVSLDGLLLAKIDVKTGDVIHRASLSARSSAYRLSRDRRTLYGVGGYPHGLIAIDTDTIEIRQAYDFAVMSGTRGRLARHEDYVRVDHSIRDGDNRVFHTPQLQSEYKFQTRQQLSPEILYFHELPDRRLAFLNECVSNKKWCLVEIDVEAGTLNQLTEEALDWSEKRLIRFFDGERRTIILNDTSCIPASDGTKARNLDAFGHAMQNIVEHPDVNIDGVRRYGIAMTVCDYRGHQVGRRSIVVRMATATSWKGENASYLSDEEFEECLRLDAAKIANQDDRDLQLRKVVRWDGERKKEQALVTPYDTSLNGLCSLAWPLKKDPAGHGFWVWFRDNCLRFVGYEGGLGPLIRLEHQGVESSAVPRIDFERDGSMSLKWGKQGTYRFHPNHFKEKSASVVVLHPNEPYAAPASHKATFAAYINSQITTRIVLGEWNCEECAKALREQSIRIRSQFRSLIVGTRHARYLKFEYLVGASAYLEPDFYGRIVDAKFDLAREMRELLSNYLVQLRGTGLQPWQGGGIPGLGSAMRALVLLDPSSTDILRTFMKMREGEYEGYCWETIIPELIERHGWRDRKMLRFGIFAVLHVHWSGLSGFDPNRDGLLTAAAAQVGANEFADMVIAEIYEFKGKQQWNDQDEVWQLREFCAGLNSNDPFQVQLLAALNPHLPA